MNAPRPEQIPESGRFEFVFETSPDSLDLEALHGIGPKTAEKLRERGYTDQSDLLFCLPNGYRRVFRHNAGIEMHTQQCEYAEFVGKIAHVSIPNKYSNAPVEVVLEVGGTKFKVLWFNLKRQSFIKQLEVGRWMRVEGELDWSEKFPTLVHPEFSILGNKRPDTPPASVAIEPVYPSFQDIADSRLENAIEQVAENLLPQLKEILPADIVSNRDLCSAQEAFEILHVRRSFEDLKAFEKAKQRARHRLVYEEFFVLQYQFARTYALQRRAAEAPACTHRSLGRDVVRQLPFDLTDDQRDAIAQIADDLSEQLPMRRLLQGDVGSGKTVVAFMAAGIVIGSGYQTAMMAPTDILATQHLETAQQLLEGLDIEVDVLTGSISGEERSQTLERLAAGDIDLIIGTHALFQNDVVFDELGFAIIDEQHKFGVEQRQSLLDKGRDPHLLAMTATPIPRSLAHGAFGDLDLSVIREKPPGRKPVRTFLRRSPKARDVYEYIAKRIHETGEQAFFVYPLVEPSDKAPNRKNVLDSARQLANGVMDPLRVGILHGQMPSEDKDKTMSAFNNKEIDVLCATTVIEVGMDVENATLMVIESPESFGLSQLHQLRGRIGRGQKQALCVLLAGQRLNDKAQSRLTSFVETNDGFELAERDLQMRGPGQLLGERQTGLPEFRFGDLIRDEELLEQARTDARRILLGDVAVD
jgi:ATP-dependent DNA helicase RecG